MIEHYYQEIFIFFNAFKDSLIIYMNAQITNKGELLRRDTRLFKRPFLTLMLF